MTFKPIEWKESYNVGNTLIDTHHRVFFELVQEFSESHRVDDRTKLEECLEFLTEYLTMHLQAEEELLAQMGYPNLEEHITAHQNFASRVVSLKNVYESNPDNFKADDLLQLMQNWFLMHILEADLKALSN